MLSIEDILKISDEMGIEIRDNTDVLLSRLFLCLKLGDEKVYIDEIL